MVYVYGLVFSVYRDAKDYLIVIANVNIDAITLIVLATLRLHINGADCGRVVDIWKYISYAGRRSMWLDNAVRVHVIAISPYIED